MRRYTRISARFKQYLPSSINHLIPFAENSLSPFVSVWLFSVFSYRAHSIFQIYVEFFRNTHPLIGSRVRYNIRKLEQSALKSESRINNVSECSFSFFPDTGDLLLQESNQYDYNGMGPTNGQSHPRFKPPQNAINILNHVLLRKSAVAQLTKWVFNVHLWFLLFNLSKLSKNTVFLLSFV